MTNPSAADKDPITWNPRMSLLSSNANGLSSLLRGDPSVPPMMTPLYLTSDNSMNTRQDLRRILQDVLDLLENDPLFDEDAADQEGPQDDASSPRRRGNRFPHSRSSRSSPRE